MIIDSLKNRKLYKLNSRFELAFNYLEKTEFSKLETGKHPISGNEVFALVNEYKTQAEEKCVLEAHKKYIDLQFMVSGSEQIGYKPIADHMPSKEYDSESDYALYVSKELSHLNFTSNMFAIFFPGDLHMPGIIAGESALVKKIVVKVLI